MQHKPNKSVNKYRNSKVIYNGETFDSKKEFNRWLVLKDMEKKGEIFNLQKQVKFELIPKQDGERAVNYVADFVYYKKSYICTEQLPPIESIMIVEDVKSEITRKNPEYIIKRKLMLFIHGIKIKEI